MEPGSSEYWPEPETKSLLPILSNVKLAQIRATPILSMLSLPKSVQSSV